MAMTQEEFNTFMKNHQPNSPDWAKNPIGAGLGAIGSLYNGRQVADAYGSAASDAESQANSLKSQMDNMPTLAQMYGQDSPYALQMQKQLAAKDAAAGRNSQYGPRLQALQADLAGKGSQYAQQQAAMANAYSNARNNANNQRVQAVNGQAQVQGQQLGALFNLGEKSGLIPYLNQGISNMAQPYLQKAGDTLSDMFPSWGGGGVTNQPMDQSPYGGGGDYSGYTTGSGYSQPEQSYGPIGSEYNNPVPESYPQDTGDYSWLDQQ